MHYCITNIESFLVSQFGIFRADKFAYYSLDQDLTSPNPLPQSVPGFSDNFDEFHKFFLNDKVYFCPKVFVNISCQSWHLDTGVWKQEPSSIDGEGVYVSDSVSAHVNGKYLLAGGTVSEVNQITDQVRIMDQDGYWTAGTNLPQPNQ